MGGEIFIALLAVSFCAGILFERFNSERKDP
jgi:hypothetical protein